MDTPVIEQTVETVEQPVAPVAPTYQDRWHKVKETGGPAYEKLALTGDLDEAEKLLPKETDVKAESSPATEDQPDTPSEEGAVETAPAPGTGTKTKESKSPRTSWSELREAKAKAEARAELLEQQLAEMRKSPPAKEVPKVEAADPAKPKRPRLADFEDIDKYEAAMETYEEARDSYRDTKSQEKLEQERIKQNGEVVEKTWEQQVAEESKANKDFVKIAFSAETPASDMMIMKMKAHPKGAKIALHLGQNREIAARLAQKTNIPNFDQLDSKSPEHQRLLGRAEALVDAEFERIAETLTKPPTTPQEKTIARLPKPSGELHIEPKGSAAQDELTEILKMTDQDAKSRAYKQFRNRERQREMGL